MAITGTQVEDELKRRFQEKLDHSLPATDIWTTLIDLLMKFVTGSLAGPNPPATPSAAVDAVKAMSPFRQSFLRAQMERQVRLKHGRQASQAVYPAVMSVAKEATPEEQLRFAGSILEIEDNPFASV